MTIYETKWVKTWKEGVRAKLYFIPVKTNGAEDVAWTISVAQDDSLKELGVRFLLGVLRLQARAEINKIVKDGKYVLVEKSPDEILKIQKLITSKFYGISE